MSDERAKDAVSEMIWRREDIAAVEVDLLVLEGREMFEVLLRSAVAQPGVHPYGGQQ